PSTFNMRDDRGRRPVVEWVEQFRKRDAAYLGHTSGLTSHASPYSAILSSRGQHHAALFVLLRTLVALQLAPPFTSTLIVTSSERPRSTLRLPQANTQRFAVRSRCPSSAPHHLGPHRQWAYPQSQDRCR